MTGQIPNFEITGDAMPWQEYYQLSKDGSFTKTREVEGQIESISGTFSYEDLSDGKYLKLIYDKEYGLIGSCTSKQEHLRLNDHKQLVSSWSACDGPGLIYEQTK